MKALEILKQIKDLSGWIKCGAELPYDNELENAIAELEALHQRSCEECVHRSFLDKTLTNKVTNGFCMENGFFTKVCFCCNRYEAKEQ